MADRTIKSDDTNDLVLQNNDGSAKLELNEDQTVKVTTGSDAGEDFTVNSTKLVVEGDTGNVGIGTSPSDQGTGNTNLHIHSSSTANSYLSLTNNTTGQDATSNGSVVVTQANDLLVLNRESGGHINLITTGTGDVKVTSGNLVFGTAGKGVYLGTTSQSSANLLKDYEEGTWTITNTNGAVFSSQSAQYQKIGWMVFIKGYFVVTSGASTSTSFGGLPFTIKNDEASRGIGFVPYQSQNATTGNYYGVYGNKNTKVFQFQSPGSSYFDQLKEVFFSGFYTTDE